MKFTRKITKALFEPKVDLTGKRLVVDREAGTIAARVYSFGQKYSTNDRITAPRNINVDAAHIGDADDVEPGFKVGNLAMHVMHAGSDLTAAQAAEWYNNTDTAIARGRYSVDDEGVRFDGTLFDDIDESKLDRLTASAPSGDWRWKAGAMLRRPEDMETAACDFVGSCMVNVPGFSPTYSQSPMTPMRLVASAESDELVLIDSSLVAAADGVTQEDVQEAWRDAHPQERSGGDSGEVSCDYCCWIEEFYVEPRKVVARIGDDHVEATWDTDADGNITFGAEVPVEKAWVPKESTVDEDENLTASAGGDGACGDGTCCGGECKGGKGAADAPDAEALAAAAALVAANGEQLGLDEAAVAALTAASDATPASAETEAIAQLRADVDAIAQIVHDAILSM